MNDLGDTAVSTADVAVVRSSIANLVAVGVGIDDMGAVPRQIFAHEWLTSIGWPAWEVDEVCMAAEERDPAAAYLDLTRDLHLLATVLSDDGVELFLRSAGRLFTADRRFDPWRVEVLGRVAGSLGVTVEQAGELAEQVRTELQRMP